VSVTDLVSGQRSPLVPSPPSEPKQPSFLELLQNVRGHVRPELPPGTPARPHMPPHMPQTPQHPGWLTYNLVFLYSRHYILEICTILQIYHCKNINFNIVIYFVGYFSLSCILVMFILTYICCYFYVLQSYSC